MSYAGWMDYASCLSATERRTTAAKRDDFHYKSLFLVKNKGQWNAKSGPKAAYGNFAMRTKFSERLDSKWERAGRNWSNFAHWHTSTHTTAAKLVVRVQIKKSGEVHNRPIPAARVRQQFPTEMPDSGVQFRKEERSPWLLFARWRQPNDNWHKKNSYKSAGEETEEDSTGYRERYLRKIRCREGLQTVRNQYPPSRWKTWLNW